jgi:hypothetical protein
MAGSTISTTITHTITLASGSYASPLSISTAGAVISATGTIAIFDTIGGGVIANQGKVIGAEFGIAGTSANAIITNTGSIIGNGTGDGIFLIGTGTISNGSTTATHALISGAAEGLGLIAYGGVFNITNDATITGSLAGIALTTGTISNGTATDPTALITGIVLGSGAVSNFAAITAPSPSNIAVALYGTASLLNDGVIRDGEKAINLSGSETVNNNGLIAASAARQNSAGLYGSYGIYAKSTAAVTVLNNLTGTITAGIIGIDLNAGATAANVGLISNAGTIIGAYTGAFEYGETGTVLNTGTIIGTGGASFTGTGLITEGGISIGNGGLISGAYGVVIFGPTLAASLNNTGRITGSETAIYGYGEGITIQNTGSITGSNAGIIIEGSGNIINHGLISGTIGISILPPPSLSLTSTATVINYGTIASLNGTSGVAIGLGGMNDLLIDEPSSSIIGTIAGGSDATLDLASGGPGTINGIGTQFRQFSNIDFVPGAVWRAEGNATGLASGETIAGFSAADTIILDGITESSFAYTPNTGLVINGATTLDLAGSYTTASFTVENIAAGTEILLCYLRGTRIATPAGDIPIEKLNIGDAVITKFHGYRKIKWIGRQSFTARLARNNPEHVPVRIAAGALGPNLPSRDLYISPGHSMLINNILLLAKHMINGITVTQTLPASDIEYYQLEFETHDCILAEGIWSESFADGPGMRQAFHNAAQYFDSFPDYGEPATFTMCAERPDSGTAFEAALTPITARAAAHTNPGPLRGWIDHADGPNIEGWAIDLANPQLPVMLEIRLGNTLIGHALACHHRPDLAAANLAAGRCHFTFPLSRLAPAQRSQLRVRRLQDAAELPMTQTCQKALAPVLQTFNFASTISLSPATRSIRNPKPLINASIG